MMKFKNNWIMIGTVTGMLLINPATYSYAGADNQPQAKSGVNLESLRDKYYKNLPEVSFDHQNNRLTKEAVNDYVTQLTWLSAELKRELPLIQKINSETGQAKWLRSWMEKGIYEKITANNTNFDRYVNSIVTTPLRILEKAEILEADTFRENYSNEKQRNRFEINFKHASETLHAAAIMEQAMGGGDSYKNAAIRTDGLIDVWNTQVAQMAGGRTLPVDINNARLTKTAKAVLNNAAYGISGWDKLIVNAGVKPGERIEHEVKGDKLTTVVRRWEEFQVTTVEQEDGKYMLYYHTLKNFSLAPATTPVNTWILSNRVGGGEISKANL